MRAHQFPAERGLSLLELLVSLVIGLVVLIAAIGTYVGASTSAKSAAAHARMAEDARTALSVLAQQVRMAGSNPVRPNRIASDAQNPVYLPATLPTNRAPTAYAIRGCDGTFSNVATAALADDLLCSTTGGSQPDSLSVSFEADRFNTSPDTSTPTDCAGRALVTATATIRMIDPATGIVSPQDTPYFAAENRYYIATLPSEPNPSLMCRGNGAGSAPIALAENIEDLQILYGVASPSATSSAGNVSGYLDATSLLTHPSLVSESETSRWSKVVTVRICVVARSEGNIAPDAASARYLKCDGTLESNPPDLRLRRAFSTTVVVRNRA